MSNTSALCKWGQRLASGMSSCKTILRSSSVAMSDERVLSYLIVVGSLGTWQVSIVKPRSVGEGSP